jgi:hypothetical protein
VVVAGGIFLRAAIVFADETGPLIGGCQMRWPRSVFRGVATGEIHHGASHGHDSYAVALGRAQQFAESRVGATAAKRHQYAVGHIELAPSLK